MCGKNNSDTGGKLINIQHAVIAAVRSWSVMSPLHIRLGVHLHRMFGSRKLFDILKNFGFCAACKGATKFEASITTNAPATVDENAYVQFVFNNANYNV